MLHGQPSLLSLDEIKTLLKHPNFQDLLNELLVPYFFGSFVVGLVLAVFAFWITLWISRRSQSQKQE